MEVLSVLIVVLKLAIVLRIVSFTRKGHSKKPLFEAIAAVIVGSSLFNAISLIFQIKEASYLELAFSLILFFFIFLFKGNVAQLFRIPKK